MQFSVRSFASSQRPRTSTPAIFWVFEISLNGLSVSNTISARFPAAFVPNSVDPLRARSNLDCFRWPDLSDPVAVDHYRLVLEETFPVHGDEVHVQKSSRRRGSGGLRCSIGFAGESR
jgi:hypothetical protein